MSKIKKAVITSAGVGTRFLPYTKSIQKEMLPVLNRPIIDYVVDDCVHAGVEEIIFVINQHNGSQIKDYYSDNQFIKDYLIKMKKTEKLPLVENLYKKAKFTFIEQSDDSSEYGTAVPLKLVKKYVENEDAFLMLMGDDFILNENGESEVQSMIKHFESKCPDALVSAITIPEDLLYKYGVMRFKDENGEKFLVDFIEKPETGKAPSNLANISKYIFTPKIFDSVENQKIDAVHNELLITDTIIDFAKNHNVVVHVSSGQYLDSGYILGWLKANIEVALGNKDLKNDLMEYLHNKIS